jgi:hypothetical protein
MAIQNTATNNVLYFKISKTRGTTISKNMVILFSNTGLKNSFVSIGFKMSDYRKQQKPEQSSRFVFEDNLGLSLDDKYALFKTNKPNLATLVDFFKHYIKETPASEIINLSNTTEEYGQFRNELVYGWGIKPNETLPKTCEFGKVIIELDKLYYKNILAVKDKKMRNITGFKNAPVSNEFVEIVMNMCRNNTLPNKSELQQLNSSNKELWDLLIHYSGLHKSNVDSSKSETIQKLKERLSLVEGEMEAGNNNPELVDELRGLLFKLKNLDVITTYQAKQHFKQLTTNL